MKILAAVLLLFLLTACGTQPPVGHSEGPPLVSPVLGRVASAYAEFGNVIEVQLLDGMVRVGTQSLFFGVNGYRFDQFHVYSGESVYAGQLLATLYTPRQREQLENQQIHVDRLYRTHALAAELWYIEYELLRLRYNEQLRIAADTLDTSAMDAAQRLYLEIDRMRLLRGQEETWQQLERADANARLQEIRGGLQGTELLAPFDGVITYVTAIPHGTFIDTATRILFIAPNDAEKNVELIHGTLPARARIQRIYSEINGASIPLEYIPITMEEAAYNTLHGLPRRTLFKLPQNTSVPLGASVRIFVYTTYRQNVLRIPANALVGLGINAYVYRNENGTWQPVHPTFGARTTAFVEVLYGLAEGDEVLVN
ncbi:MAG: efflux RND transporter periplasmic adaptor subunit [Defluviitaleaceae bacterium]|nr:efflux RND transporter periplasmic adaptor subunit [Defluviitaleaceae bacterium]MCL2273846.1 efflux RND transporter periplasmic adaptor subunit [Defluviitaleaceae bacterium]